MKNLMPPEVQAAAENLMLVAREHGITVAGWLFAAKPVCLLSFGTCNDAHKIELYEMLCKMFQAKMEEGHVQLVKISGKQ